MERSRTLAQPGWPQVKGTGWSLLKAPERQTVGQLGTLWEAQNYTAGYRTFL